MDYSWLHMQMIIPTVNRARITLWSAGNCQQRCKLPHLPQPHPKYLSTASLTILPPLSPQNFGSSQTEEKTCCIRWRSKPRTRELPLLAMCFCDSVYRYFLVCLPKDLQHFTLWVEITLNCSLLHLTTAFCSLGCPAKAVPIPNTPWVVP